MAAASWPALSADDVAAFHRDGFLVVKQLLPEAEVARIEAAFYATFERVKAVAADPAHADTIRAAAARGDKGHIIIRPSENGARYTYQLRDPAGASSSAFVPGVGAGATLAVRHAAWCGKDEPFLLEAGRHPAILATAARLLGVTRPAEGASQAPVKLTQMINQAHFKEPNDGVAFPWHQDSHHRRMAHGDFVDVNGRGSYVQVIVSLEDTSAESGPVAFIPGSGKGGHIGGVAGLDPLSLDPPRVQIADGRAVAPLLKRGDAVCLNPYVIHGSEPNTSASWRRTFVNGFAYPGAQRARDVVYCEEVEVPTELLAAAE